jgi:hypothetical protein
VEEERRGEGEGLGILGGFAIATGNQAAMWSVVAVKWLKPYITPNARHGPACLAKGFPVFLMVL